MTAHWCIDQTTGRADVTTRIAHAFPVRPDGSLELRTLCGLECDLRQDVAHTRYPFVVCETCKSKESTR